MPCRGVEKNRHKYEMNNGGACVASNRILRKATEFKLPIIRERALMDQPLSAGFEEFSGDRLQVEGYWLVVASHTSA